ncbi:MAG: Protein-methionine-sulfoxide reductase catalytic subunit MsrP [Gemmatimonadaceae bacterium]|nr:Protein-methionine-sulfoxide reductase catalytic subunit MsrP [Gemmatimonadaceae bacterium]
MIIRRTPPHPIASSEITPESVYLNRRQFLEEAGLLSVVALAMPSDLGRSRVAQPQSAYPTTMGSDLRSELTPWDDVTTYNNFYEFGTDKSDPAANARTFRPRPWSVRVEGLVKKPADYDLEDFIKPYKLEERIYRHRCVEAWSMVVPWLGFPMADLIARVEPSPSAKYVEFITLNDAKRMPGQRIPVLQWPYVEGLRLDEARNPLAFFAVGVYGKMLPNQNGAPLRHVVPWKYGFKGCKSIVKIRFTDREPRTAWNLAAPDEYGFYANVNPNVDHPRWSQAKERRIGEFRRRATLMFNGYADQVASLYSGMDLRKSY